MSDKKPTHLLQVGDEMEPLEFTVTPELAEQYLYAERDYHPRYWDKSELGPPIVHPALPLNWSNRTRSPSFYLPSGVAELHAAEQVRFLNPARVGSRLKVTWKVANVYEKRGRIWHDVDTLVSDENGTQILHRVLSCTFTFSEEAKQ